MSVTTVLWQSLCGGLGVIGFAGLFHIPRRHYLDCGIVGAVAWLVYGLMLLVQPSTVVASLVAAVPLTLVARWFAVRQKAPVTIFMVCGIFPLVPGAGIYYTALHFIRGENALFAAKGMETLKVALALGVGISLALGIPLPRAGRRRTQEK